MKKASLIFLLFGFVLLFQSCDPLMIYDNYLKTDSGKWGHGDPKSFEVEIPDSIYSYNVLVNVRHTTDYPVSNLYVFLTVNGPDGESVRDTLEIFVTDTKGKWQGYGFGKIKHISRMYRKNVRFSRPGKYTFTIDQGMRYNEVPVTDVGLRIEKFKDFR